MNLKIALGTLLRKTSGLIPLKTVKEKVWKKGFKIELQGVIEQTAIPVITGSITVEDVKRIEN